MLVKDVATTDVGFNYRYNCLAHQNMAVPSMEKAKRIEEFVVSELADSAVRAPATFSQQGPAVTVNALVSLPGQTRGGTGPQKGAPSPQQGTLSPQKGHRARTKRR